MTSCLKHVALIIVIFLTKTSFCFAQKSISESIISDKNSFYYVDLKNYPQRDNQLPIGVFDSGTGGLTVLNAILTYDQYNNQTGAKGKDGEPDFSKEDLIYLADQANMPYGNYAAVGKVNLLNEHIIKDTQFMLGKRYYTPDGACRIDKKPVKTLVIACNTATAYGKENIEAFISKAGIEMKVIGVIDAGVRGALETFKKDENGSIGIFATAGTVASKGYTNTLTKQRAAQGYSGNIQYFSVGGVGLAEAVDELPDYLDRKQTEPRLNYRGPSLADNNLLIDRALMDVYNFDFSEYKMLCDAKKLDDCSQLQINSADNYVRYHLVSLLENMKKTPGALPLKTLILGCTHYPFMADAINKVLKELRAVQQNGESRYKHLLAENVTLIDPSINTAQELYEHLQAEKLFSQNGDFKNAEFYISIPNELNKNVRLDANKNFSYDYKYGRNEGQDEEFIVNTPFSNANISKDVFDRLQLQTPAVYELIENFWKQNAKVSYLKKSDEKNIIKK